ADARPSRLLVRVPVLQDAEALRALARLTVHAEPPAGCAAGGVAGPVAERVLPPPALDRRLCQHEVLVDPPLARRPAQDLPRGTGELPVHPGRDAAVGARVVAREEGGTDQVPRG